MILTRSRYHFDAFARRLRAIVGGAAITMLALTMAIGVLAVPSFRRVVDGFEAVDAIFAALGATYGTILALVLTLSLVPIQRAGEAWSTSIVRLYRRDRLTHGTFILLGALCTVSFWLAVPNLTGIPAGILLACSLASLGVSLDMLRRYHGHVCELLDPGYAVSLAVEQAKSVIDRTRAWVVRTARRQHKRLGTAEKERFDVKDIQAAIYPTISGYPAAINTRISDLEEIAIKAIARGEKLLVSDVIRAIVDLTAHYLTSRREDLVIRPAPDVVLATTSDVDVVTNFSYERLNTISRSAVSQNDEATAIRVSEAYQVLATHTANLKARDYRNDDAPLTFAPIHYAFQSVKYGQVRGLDEFVYQSSAILARVSLTAPKDVDRTAVHIPVVDGLTEIAIYLYGKRSFGLAEAVVAHQFAILEHLLKQRDFHFMDMLRHVLGKIETLTPLAIVNEALAGRLSITHPLGKAYGLVNPYSLGYLFDRAATLLPEVDEEREWINPYNELVEMAKVISRHLRNTAENNEFGDSFLIWDINHLIKHIAVRIAKLSDQPLRSEDSDGQELIDQLCWIAAFYWVAFHGKKTVDGRRADECCDSLAYIGLLFFSRSHLDVLRTCISNIRSILESYCETASPADLYTVADLLAHLWGIRLVLAAGDVSELIEVVDPALNRKPSGLTDEQWQSAQETILLRRQQLEERLGGHNDRRRRDDAETIMRQLLREWQ